MTSTSGDPWIRLYVEPDAPLPEVVPSASNREWFGREMYRCLPLTVGNELGWTILNPAAFSVVWDGGELPDAVSGTSEGSHVQARFGHGTFSVHPGFYVRTSPDVDLLIKGVPNQAKDGVACLEAMIEADWFDGSFLVSMRLTRPGLTVSFERGEPLFQMVPYPRGWLRRFRATRAVEGPDHAAFFAAAEAWHRDRAARIEPHLRGEAPIDLFDGRYRRNLRASGDLGSATHETSPAVPSFEPVDETKK